MGVVFFPSVTASTTCLALKKPPEVNLLKKVLEAKAKVEVILDLEVRVKVNLEVKVNQEANQSPVAIVGLKVNLEVNLVVIVGPKVRVDLKVKAVRANLALIAARIVKNQSLNQNLNQSLNLKNPSQTLQKNLLLKNQLRTQPISQARAKVLLQKLKLNQLKKKTQKKVEKTLVKARKVVVWSCNSFILFELNKM